MFLPIISQWEPTVAMANPVLMESAPKPLSSLPPIEVMLQIKFYQDWPTDLGDSMSTENLIRPQGHSEVTDLIRCELELI